MEQQRLVLAALHEMQAALSQAAEAYRLSADEYEALPLEKVSSREQLTPHQRAQYGNVFKRLSVSFMQLQEVMDRNFQRITLMTQN